MTQEPRLHSPIQKRLSILAGAFFLAATFNAAAGTEAPTLATLSFVRGIPFVPVTVGAVKTELMFDSGGRLGITLPDDLIKRSGSVRVLEHKSKHGDAAGHVYEVADIVADEVSVAGVPLAKPVAGSVHYSWGLNVSSGNAGAPDDLSRKQANGTIGLQAFENQALLFDYAHQQLGIYPPGQLPDLAAAGWESLDLKYDNEGPSIVLKSAEKPLQFVLDTGGNASLIKPSSINYSHRCSHGASESAYCGSKQMKDLKTLGGKRFGQQKFELVEMKGVSFDGILGADFFSRYLVIFDLAHHKLWIKGV